MLRLLKSDGFLYRNVKPGLPLQKELPVCRLKTFQ
jgi:hypothetical protein